MPPTKTPGVQSANLHIAPTFDPTNPFIVQADRSVLVEVDNPRYAEARDALAPFAELEKSPEHIHTYRVSNLSLWNAAAAGITADQVIAVLQKYTRYPIPQNLPADIAETVSRYGRVKLERIDEKQLKLVCDDRPLLMELSRQKKLKDYLGEKLDDVSFAIEPAYRGVLKQALIGIGYPAEDLAGYTEGSNLPMKLRESMATTGEPFRVRCARGFGRHCAAVWGRQDDRWHRGHVAPPEKYSGADHEHHGREAVEAGDSGQDDADRGRGKRVHRGDERHRPGDCGDVPNPHLPPRQD
jgi:DNA excision repair protein ERCC-3